VALIYSRHCQGSIEWAKYLHKLFAELSKHRGKLKVRHFPAEDLASAATTAMPSEPASFLRNSKLQLLLVSPNLLSFLAEEEDFVLGGQLYPDRVLAVMLGVGDDQISPDHRRSKLRMRSILFYDTLLS